MHLLDESKVFNYYLLCMHSVQARSPTGRLVRTYLAAEVVVVAAAVVNSITELLPLTAARAKRATFRLDLAAKGKCRTTGKKVVCRLYAK